MAPVTGDKRLCPRASELSTSRTRRRSDSAIGTQSRGESRPLIYDDVDLLQRHQAIADYLVEDRKALVALGQGSA
jgi:hypothetical protein